MTIIAGLVTEDGVAFAADSRTISGGHVASDNTDKIFKRNNILFGVAGWYKTNQVIKYMMEFNSPPKTDRMDWLVTSFAPNFQEVVGKIGHSKVESNEERLSSVVMLGFHGRIYVMAGDFSVMEKAAKPGEFAAIGSGRDYALGSLFTSDDLSTKDRLKLAVKSAQKFDTGCGGKVKYLEL